MAKAPRLAIVGASARAAAFSALRAGFDVVTADLFADEDLRRRCPATRIASDAYPESLADWLAEQDVDAWMYTGALENHPDLVDRMAEIRPLWGNKGEALRRCRDPFELWHTCQDVDLRCPEIAPEPKGLPHDGTWLCKTYRSSNGKGTWLLNGKPSLVRAMESAAVFQQRVLGRPYSAVYAVSGKASEMLGVTNQLVSDWDFGAPSWAYCGSTVCASPLGEDAAASLRRIGDMLCRNLQLRGLVGVDCVINGDGVFLIEINPRFTASMELIASPVGDHAACVGLRSVDASDATEPLPAGKAILYAKRPTTSVELFFRWANAEAGAGRLADIPAVGTRIEAGHPVLTILEARPAEGVLERLKKRVVEVESRLYR